MRWGVSYGSVKPIHEATFCEQIKNSIHDNILKDIWEYILTPFFLLALLYYITLFLVSIVVSLFNSVCAVPWYIKFALELKFSKEEAFEIEKTQKNDDEEVWTLTTTCDSDVHEKISADGIPMYVIFGPFEHICSFRNWTQPITMQGDDDGLERGDIVAQNERGVK